MIKLTELSEVYLKSYMEAFEDYRTERDRKPDRVGAHFFWLVDDERNYFISEMIVPMLQTFRNVI